MPNLLKSFLLFTLNFCEKNLLIPTKYENIDKTYFNGNQKWNKNTGLQK